MRDPAFFPKYARSRIFLGLSAIDTPEADQAAFVKAEIVFWLLADTDGHAKNQHPPHAWRTVRANASLRHHLDAAKPRCQADHAEPNEARYVDR
jgi:hypothetical protein